MKQDKKFAGVLVTSQKILAEYDLCDHCLGRLFAKKLGLASSRLLGRKIHKALKKKTTRCHICKNVFDNLHTYLTKMLESSSGYEFRTFLVGATLKPSVMDRDDHIRSQFKLRGIDGIKTSITRELARQFSKKTKKRSQQLDPELTITVDFKTESCSVYSRPVYVFGRYVKEVRGIPQKQKPCENCLGKGCFTCGHHGMTGYDSVEGMLCRYLFERFGAPQAKITWVGGEDSTSLVLGAGRPFFARIANPKKRNPRLQKKIKADKITIRSLKIIPKIPVTPVSFVSKVGLLVSSENPVRQEDIEKLGQLQKSTIAIYENSGRRVEKSIYDVHYKINSENSFRLFLKVDGGVPLKRLVTGENVFPNVSDLISIKSKCETFDFEEVRITN
ncbi:MAG: tRNA pseudouridine(54/55) synthase Pus10 [Candidatus Nitrosotenuis sp.]